ncbi:MAG: hypothetical protein WB475_09185, partial [Pseudolabrys sp.]
EGYRLEKKDDDSYLINARFNVAVYQHDGVSLEKIGVFRETHKPRKFAGRSASLDGVAACA